MSFFKRLRKKLRKVFKKAVDPITKKIADLKATDFNFGNTTELAMTQDKLIVQYKAGDKKISSKQMSELKNNTWVNLAAKFAPNNLVIRQYCLIDLFSNKPLNANKIMVMVKKVSYNNKIWAEGYTYWLYTLKAVELWISAFNNYKLNSIIRIINLNFLNTSYLKGDKYYPAPFGDLRKQPLANNMQKKHEIKTMAIANVILKKNENDISYRIIGKPLGLNTHIPKDNSIITISNGIPQKFKFYRGYDKKYPNKVAEIADTFDPKRVKSI